MKNIIELQNSLKNYKKGTYTKVQWKTETNVNGVVYVKISKGVCRFCSYNGVAKKTPTTTETAKPSNTITLIKDICYFNTNTQNTLVYIFSSKNKKHSIKTAYYVNGKEISKQEYENNVKVKKSNISIMFTKKLQDIISIG